MAYRVYLVDDDRFLLDLYAVKFKNAGHDVTTFGSGEDLVAALRKGGESMPDAVLMDLIMPGIGGFGALEAIRKENLAQGVKIIILSNQGQDSDIEKAKLLAVDGYIIKASAIPSEVLAETLRIIDPKAGGDASHT
ncbi:MAG: two component transcriptional regulator, two-component system, OmpR family, response regulator [Parcubacteria group bacterium]|nr:two component transcriptional regulator, two-component system, OmpR family, response regulator [Parcubacteria group bacterium]